MGFPKVEATNTSFDSVASTSHAVALPSGIVNGEMLLVFMTMSAVASGFSAPAGWIELYDADVTVTIGVFGAYRFADGTEGATVTITTTASVGGGHNSYRISGHAVGVPPYLSAQAVGASTTPDPPSLDPPVSTKDYLWIAVAHHDGGTLSAYPANYTGGIVEPNGSTGICASATRQLRASSEDPGTFTLDTIDDWAAYTLAIKPPEPVRLVSPLALGA